MDLQTALQGIPRAERKQRGWELIERVGLTYAADRRVGDFSGGMKRRLDLALALVHRPRVLFLDEPTTGLDPQSRTALWEEVARLVKEEGMTVFLTTQYLEEADVLADRVGIIDHGDIVAEGTPAKLKAEIGRPSVEVVPLDGKDFAALSEVLARFGELEGAARRGRRPPPARRRGHGGRDPGARRCGPAVLERGASLANARRRLPRQDGPLPEGAGEEADEEAPDALRQLSVATRYARSAGRRVTPSSRVQLGKLARRSIARTVRQPVLIIPNVVFPLFILAVISAGAGDQATQVPGFPTANYTTFFLAATLIQGASGAMTVAGNTLGDDIATGFLNRLSLTPLRPRC